MSHREVEGTDDPLVSRFGRVLRADVDQTVVQAQRSGRLADIVAAAAIQHRQRPGFLPGGRWRWSPVALLLLGGTVFAGIWSRDPIPAPSPDLAHRSKASVPVAPFVISIPHPSASPLPAIAVRGPSAPSPVLRPRPIAIVDTAAVLFTRANRARRAGQYAAAARDYGQLQKFYPAATETHVSRVALGRLLLDRNQDLARAQRLFDEYLDAQPKGALAEQALAGRALTLQKRHRPAEEQPAWQRLLTEFPDSAHADEARARLREFTRK